MGSGRLLMRPTSARVHAQEGNRHGAAVTEFQADGL